MNQKQNNPLVVIENQIQVLETQFTELAMTNEARVVFAKEAHFAIQAMQKNDYLLQTAMQNPNSLKAAVLNIASVGLTLNPVLKQAYLIPRDRAVILDISYMGLCDIATQEGALAMVKSQLVHSKDEFLYNGVDKEPTHKFNPFGDRGEVVGVYCVAKTVFGDYLTEFMTIGECHSIRNRTDIWRKKQAGPWKTDEGEMMKKTVIKRASKLWPRPKKAIKLNNAIEVLHDHEGIDFEREQAEAEEEKKYIAEKKDKEILEKKDVLEKIKVLCGYITQGTSVQEKGAFMNEFLQVNKFGDLNFKKLDELKAILETLKNISEEKPGDTIQLSQ